MFTVLKIFFPAFLLFLFLFPSQSFAQASPTQEIYKAEVVRIITEGETFIEGGKSIPYQIVAVKFLDGPNMGKEVTIEHGKISSIRDNQKVQVGEKVVVLKLAVPKGVSYQIVDKYRLDSLLPLIVFFFVLILILSRLKGLGSIAGLFVSLLVITQFIVPQILAGRDALVVSIFGSFFIMITTIYLAHGFSRKTHVAVVATCIALIVTGFLGYFFVDFVHLSGLGNDDTFSLQFGQTANINFKGLLLGGIIIGALGVLDDITTGLSATIEELKLANPSYTFLHLVRSGFRVGSEHIASLVNTLVLAYAGVALPLFLFIILNPMKQPLWAILNSEMIIEEIVRALAGSIGLIMAVPITTLLGAWIVTRHKEKQINKK